MCKCGSEKIVYVFSDMKIKRYMEACEHCGRHIKWVSNIEWAEIKETNHFYNEETKVEFWENWLSSKKYYTELGYKVSKSLQKIMREKIELVHEENRRLSKENEEYAIIKQILTDSGINTARTWNLKYDVKDRLEELKSQFPPKMEENINVCISQLTELMKTTKSS